MSDHHARDLVVVVDDDPNTREMLEALFEDEFDVRPCPNAITGIFAVFDHAPRVVILDLEMPQVGGWEAVRTLREDPRTSGTRIVIFSASEKPDVRERAENNGCSFVAKPIQTEADVEQLVSAVRAC